MREVIDFAHLERPFFTEILTSRLGKQEVFEGQEPLMQEIPSDTLSILYQRVIVNAVCLYQKICVIECGLVSNWIDREATIHIL